jgi:acetyl-CoA acetyltransferase
MYLLYAKGSPQTKHRRIEGCGSGCVCILIALSNIAGGDEDVVAHLDIAVMRWRGMGNRKHVKSIRCKGYKGVRLERETVEGIQGLLI